MTPPSAVHRRRRYWLWGATSAAGALLVAIAVVAWTFPLSSDTARKRIVRALSAKLDSDVQLGAIALHTFPRFRIEGSGLVVRKHGRTDVPPLITIARFSADANLMGLLRKHLSHVQLEGLDIKIPPGDHRPDSDRHADRGARDLAPDDWRIENGVVIDTLETSDATITIIPREENKNPKVWAIHQLRMRQVGIAESMPFDATLTNGVPPGEIDVAGHFGPWGREDPGTTPLDGTFNFARADLGVFPGISGMLAAHGYFDGTLAQVDVNGQTDTPDFTIKVGGHPFPLHVKYEALVDGTNGDTRLRQIDAWFLSSYLHATGAVLDAPKGQQGRTVMLDVAMDKSRIEDIMTMAVQAATPPMIGGLTLTTKFLLPPGENDVSERLRLDGRFVIGHARFTNYDVQGKIEELSKRGRGKVGEPNKDRVASDFDGRFKLADGQLTLPGVSFAVPGARVELAGAYALKAETIDFKGRLLLDANVSQTTTGLKSLLLKAVDPLFKQKDGSGSVIPIKISGTRKAPDFGLDVRRVFKREN